MTDQDKQSVNLEMITGLAAANEVDLVREICSGLIIKGEQKTDARDAMVNSMKTKAEGLNAVNRLLNNRQFKSRVTRLVTSLDAKSTLPDFDMIPLLNDLIEVVEKPTPKPVEEPKPEMAEAKPEMAEAKPATAEAKSSSGKKAPVKV